MRSVGKRAMATGFWIFDFGLVENHRIERGAPQGEVVEGGTENVDTVLLGPLERMRRALGDGTAGILYLGERWE